MRLPSIASWYTCTALLSVLEMPTRTTNSSGSSPSKSLRHHDQYRKRLRNAVGNVDKVFDGKLITIETTYQITENLRALLRASNGKNENLKYFHCCFKRK